jgi:hypothetical protein
MPRGSAVVPRERRHARNRDRDGTALHERVAMWQPNRAQWAIVWTVAVVLILAWPPDSGRSLGMKALNWLADPADALPTLPPPLPMGLDDDGDAVAAHDAQESAYYERRDSSTLTRWRMQLKEATVPIDPQTARQLLVALAVASALVAWRLDRR